MARTRKLTQPQYETLASFRFALRRFLRFSEAAAQAAGITPQQHQALLAVKGFSSTSRMTVGELAGRLQIAHHSAVGLTDRLILEKLVSRQVCKEDRRRVYVVLTRRGEALLETLSSVHHEELRRVGPEIRSLLERLGGDGG